MKKKTGCLLASGCLGVPLIIVAIVICISGYYFFDILYVNKTSTEWIKERTGITIPENAQIVYEYEEEHGFTPGRSAKYYVFKFEEEPSDWLEENRFSNETDDNFVSVFKNCYPPDVELGEEGYIPTEFRLDFEKPYYWLKAPDAYYFAYQPDSLLLMVYAVPW